MSEASRLPESNKPAIQWQLSFALLIAIVAISLFWKALLYLAVFSGAGITAVILSLRAKQSRPFSIGSGLIVGTLAAVALSAMIDSKGSKTIPYNVQADAAATTSLPKRFHQPKAGEPVFFITPLFGNIRRSTFKYELMLKNRRKTFHHKRRR
ncbi:MAG: hypothetical protein B7Z37_16170 [Verrucomicrobia bacterium 12-59-8]|nr:MAG: hypothetical protein B7Z37_16170 [Verrucomicrobia bacterium 12-59-8]